MTAAAGPQLEHADPTWQSWLLLRLARATLATGALHDAELLVERAETHTARLKLPAGGTRQLRHLGARAPSRTTPRSTRGDLTERERQVADLVVEGHSNKRIAATLYLSDKTVANTLTRVYAKLGIRSRTQLARTHTTKP